MGLSNTIITEEDFKCSKCKKSLRMSSKYDKATTGDEIHLQSKDLYGAAYVFKVGHKIVVTWGDLKFESNSDAKWEGCGMCYHCNNLETFDITIEKGIITKITQFTRRSS
ncbi:hypothetical protein LCGC14_0441960 [marine sediment metagenome]|uniref:Uncharacterized protein n=1 Tax=marine sediment metagenome TaxID=412755 RepID=A0A0F9T3F0_9ZZZZ